MRFSFSKATWKAAVMVVIAYLVAEVNAMIEAGTFPTTKEDWQQRGVALCVGLVFGAMKALHNVIKNREMKGNPLKARSSYPSGYMWALTFAVALGLSGCVGMAPAVMGKTNYSVEFSDVTAEQATNYRMNVKAPAGVDLATVTGMTYDWSDEGGAISVSQQGNVNTEVQAQAIAEISRQQLEAFQSGLNALAPFVGQYMDARVRQGEIRAGVIEEALSKIDPAQLEAILEALQK